ncbi:MAG TPA: beta-propeller fold lactonase family protein [Solirubrobacteraceae bacterium]|nr:beta-propeller fold lactonase family protein [Solirubrobacteraceae bacterium]
MPSLLRGAVAVLGATVGLALVLAGPAIASADHIVGHVYTDDNTTGINTISGFDRHAGGALTPIPGSPFIAGGAGTGSGLASQGAVQVSSDGRYLLAVDAGSNQISVLRIHSDGRLTLVHSGPVASGGDDPVSLTEHDGLVYVANAGSADSNYTGFVLGWHGQLEPLPGSTFSLPGNAQPGDVLFNSDGRSLVGTRVGTTPTASAIDSFRVGWDGRLVPAPGSPFPAQGAGPFGSEFRPTDPDQLFVSNAHNAAPDSGTVSAFGVSRDGTLFSIGASPFPDQQMAPCWVEITHDGRYLFTVNTASGSISRYSIAPSGSLSLLGSTPVSGGKGVGAVDARLSTDGQTLYVNESASGQIGEFAVNGGNLTELGSVPVSTGSGAAGLAVN